ncbi:MAG: hydroxymethylglutaryl-CoA lyase [Lentihominibacter sp.]|jgi:hydroxymethylglutaryl-CoA lyase
MSGKKIEIREVGPRDGFQNLAQFVETEDKKDIIKELFVSGIKSVQITSFVNPKIIPQMKDAAVIAEFFSEKYPDKDLFALVPNLYGAKKAFEYGIKKVSFVISLSESHNKANINKTHKQSFDELKKIINNVPEIDICVDLATTFGCPFEGIPEDEKVLDFIGELINKGINNICLCDTVGFANPAQVRKIVLACQEKYPECVFEVHIHDTRGMGLACTLAAIECGITNVQSTIGGLGGCPFAPGASGNTATEDLVYMLNQMGYNTGVDFEKLLLLAKKVKTNIPGNYSGHHIYIGKSEV